MDRDRLQRMFNARTDEFGQEAKFPKLFVEKWLPEAGFETGGAQMSLLAPLHPEVYVFGPRVMSAVTCVERVMKLAASDNNGLVAGLVTQMRDAYRDEFGDINDYDWNIYRRYVSRNRLHFTTQVDRVYDLRAWKPSNPLFDTAQGQVDVDVMLQEMMYFELLGPNLQKLTDAYLHQGARRHAAFVQKWRLRA